MTDYADLYVFAGPGKTGSTAVQVACGRNQDKLLAQGAAYLGIMLELARNTPPRDWQSPAWAFRVLNFMPPEEARQELVEVLSDELARLHATGITKAFWCNEALFERWEVATSVLQTLSDMGVRVNVILRLRRHDAWAVSAYAQWGICHKSYEGPIKRFAQWIDERQPGYSDSLAVWEKVLGDRVTLRNYDTAGDAVADVMDWLGVTGIPTRRSQVAPDGPLLYAWAAFNGQYETEVLPMAYDHIIRDLLPSPRTHQTIPSPDDLMPSEADLAAARPAWQADIDKVNARLKAHGQPSLNLDAPLNLKSGVDSWEMVQFLIHAINSLQTQVTDLRKRLDARGL